ncbi:MAG: KH domain-containing protein [Verrucomicrobiae bacterium]|nr:KH domain-containing protein [Verrucomicrobiae bacterium]
MPETPKEILEKILTTLGFSGTVEMRETEDGLLLDVQSEDAGRLIGRQGQTLSELQYIVNRILHKQDPTAQKVLIDVAGYRASAKEALIKKAKEAAEKVRKWGDVVELEPMNAYDRRIVHNTLKDDPTVETYSVEVEGTDKKAILLKPRTKKS